MAPIYTLRLTYSLYCTVVRYRCYWNANRDRKKNDSHRVTQRHCTISNYSMQRTMEASIFCCCCCRNIDFNNFFAFRWHTQISLSYFQFNNHCSIFMNCMTQKKTSTEKPVDRMHFMSCLLLKPLADHPSVQVKIDNSSCLFHCLFQHLLIPMITAMCYLIAQFAHGIGAHCSVHSFVLS